MHTQGRLTELNLGYQNPIPPHYFHCQNPPMPTTRSIFLPLIMSESYQKISLQKHNVKILGMGCENIVRILGTGCATIVRILAVGCENIVKILGVGCATIVRILGMGCVTIVRILFSDSSRDSYSHMYV